MPIFQGEARNTGEFSCIVRHERQTCRKGLPSQQKVIGPDRGAKRFKLGTNSGCFARAGEIERDLSDRTEQGFNLGLLLAGIRAFATAVNSS